MGGRGAKGAVAAPSGSAKAEKAVRDAYKAAGPGPTGWVGLAALREELAARGMGRQEQDETLRRMAREGKISLIPEENQKTLRPSDRVASLWFGNEEKNLMRLR